jgi:mRNA-degrading endonuclease RelE of RelBE toxin-antitoxin system
MNIKAYPTFKKAYQKLPEQIKAKIAKQLELMSSNFRHPSLHTKRIQGTDGIWEVRVDYSYRMSFEFIDETIYLRVVGNHDDVLKKP